MTTTPEFTFNDKTGELSRGGVVLTLDPRHTQIMAWLCAVPRGERIQSRKLADGVNLLPFELATQVSNLRIRLKRTGITIEGKRGEGYRLIVGEMPKWQPTIPPPVVIDRI